MWSKIEKIIKAKNISVYQLAKMTGISRQALSQMKLKEIKNPSFDKMVKIADALDVSLDEFR
ncbi:helix-turn-helix domain-containing protein [Lactovum miscens]|uniref:Transcriptional regulator with XRE-family HTH domain n=1 Tax=Lactovum miscens TaxID=190387 RepID=A0A841C848_9LACT|nr:helix-turn-helix transcriptional regulator [Lactovum miscens]MBB5887731.1 transcriptional regulator with XRE-family HTH domain [Lactovum miscens]